MLAIKLLLGVVASATFLAPASAELQPGTARLINTVAEHVTVKIDPPKCEEYPFMSGSFTPATKTMVLCPEGVPTAEDHDTVRHETWHVIQYCMSPQNPVYLETVVDVNSVEWDSHIMAQLSPERIAFITSNYPRYAWNAEFEAYSVAQTLNATDITEIFIKACT